MREATSIADKSFRTLFVFAFFSDSSTEIDTPVWLCAFMRLSSSFKHAFTLLHRLVSVCVVVGSTRCTAVRASLLWQRSVTSICFALLFLVPGHRSRALGAPQIHARSALSSQLPAEGVAAAGDDGLS